MARMSRYGGRGASTQPILGETPYSGVVAGSIVDRSLGRDLEGAGGLTLTGGRGMGVFAPSRPRGNGYSPCSGAALLLARPCGRCHLCLGNPTGRNSEELYTLLPNPYGLGCPRHSMEGPHYDYWRIRYCSGARYHPPYLHSPSGKGLGGLFAFIQGRSACTSGYVTVCLHLFAASGSRG